MSEYKIQDTTLTSIADAVRAVGYTQASLTPAQMVSTLNNVYSIKIDPCEPEFATDESESSVKVRCIPILICEKTGEITLGAIYSDFDVVLHWTNNTTGTSGTSNMWYNYSWSWSDDFYECGISEIGIPGDSVTMYTVTSTSFHAGLGSATSETVTQTIPEPPEPPEE